MKSFVEEYLNEQKDAWSETTYKSEKSRLVGILDLLDKPPSEIHKALKARGQKPYTIRTTFIRLCSLESYGNSKGHTSNDSFKQYFVKHYNRFKHAYEKEDISITYEEAIKRIEQLPEPSRTQALGMLQTGVRISESYKIRDGRVKGKGEKTRRVYGTIKETAPRSTFSRHLKSVGLKSHMLRKLCATRLAETGAGPADLCKVFGWSSIQTAYVYLQARDEEKLETLIQKATQEK